MTRYYNKKGRLLVAETIISNNDWLLPVGFILSIVLIGLVGC